MDICVVIIFILFFVVIVLAACNFQMKKQIPLSKSTKKKGDKIEYGYYIINEFEFEYVDVYEEAGIEFKDGTTRRCKAVYESDDKLIIGEIKTIEYKQKQAKDGFFFPKTKTESKTKDVFMETGVTKKEYAIITSENKRKIALLPDDEDLDYEILK